MDEAAHAQMQAALSSLRLLTKVEERREMRRLEEVMKVREERSFVEMMLKNILTNVHAGSQTRGPGSAVLAATRARGKAATRGPPAANQAVLTLVKIRHRLRLPRRRPSRRRPVVRIMVEHPSDPSDDLNIERHSSPSSELSSSSESPQEEDEADLIKLEKYSSASISDSVFKCESGSVSMV